MSAPWRAAPDQDGSRRDGGPEHDARSDGAGADGASPGLFGDDLLRLFRQAPLATALIGQDGRLQRVNLALCELLGATEQELVGSQLMSLSDPRDASVMEATRCGSLAGAPGTEVAHEIEVRCRRSHGPTFWAAVSIRAIREASGEVPRRAIVQLFDIDERRRKTDELRHLADHDSLTGLANRRVLEAELDRQLARSRRHHEGASLLLLDLDDFKALNDQHGHPAGDAYLRHIASVLSSHIRRGDLLARLGGDEFGVVLARAGAASARVAGGNLLRQLRAHPLERAGLEVALTASGGIGALGAGAGVDDVFESADRALYHAKSLGGDCVV